MTSDGDSYNNNNNCQVNIITHYRNQILLKYRYNAKYHETNISRPDFIRGCKAVAILASHVYVKSCEGTISGT